MLFLSSCSRRLSRRQLRLLALSRRRRQNLVLPPCPEELERRRLLSNVSWTGAAEDNLWSDAKNWSDDGVPGPSDDVTINLSGNFTIAYNGGNTTIDSLNGSDALSITGGTLTIATTSTALPTPTSTLTGGLTIAGGTLIASGSATSVTAEGPVSSSEGTLLAESGATFALAGLTSVEGNGVTFSATGAGSTLNLSAATSIGGAGDAIDQTISQTNGAAVLLSGGLKSLVDTKVELDGTGPDPIAAIISMTDGILQVTGGQYSGTNAMSSMQDIDGTSVYVEDGASLSLPTVTSYTSQSSSIFDVDLSGSVLSLPALTSIVDSSAISVSATGSGALIDLSAATTFSVGGGFFSGLSASGGSDIELNSGLTSLNQVEVYVDAASTLPLDQFTSVTNGEITVEGGNYIPSNLNDINGSALSVEAGGSLSLPGVKTYTDNTNSFGGSFLAGTKSSLSLPALTSIASKYGLSIGAGGSGAVVDVSAATSINSASGLDISATGGGAIDLNSSLTSFSGADITVDGSSELPFGQFTSLTNCSITVEGGSVTFPNLTDIDESNLAVFDGGSLTLPAVKTYSNETSSSPSFGASDTRAGGIIDLPNLTTIDGDYGVQIDAEGPKSEV